MSGRSVASFRVVTAPASGSGSLLYPLHAPPGPLQSEIEANIADGAFGRPHVRAPKKKAPGLGPSRAAV